MFGDVGDKISAPIGEEKGIRGSDRKFVRGCVVSWLKCSTVEVMVFQKVKLLLESCDQ